MGFFDSAFGLVVDVLATPLAIVADVVTLGEAGAVKKVAEKVEDELEDLFGGF